MEKKLPASLPFLSLVLAVAVVSVWGFNFVAVKVALLQIPPITLCALRFLCASVPAIFLCPKPNIPLKFLFGYGLITFALQFALLFCGIAAGVTPGIAALISQLQVFFALFFAYLFMQQTLNRWQLIGALISALGIIVIGLHREGSCTLIGLVLLVCSALVWGLGNLISTQLKRVNMLSLVVWSSFIALFPLTGLAFLLEQPLTVVSHLQQLDAITYWALAYIILASTYFAYSGWSWLLSTYPVANIAPFALLSPIVALLSSSLLLGEAFESWKILSALLVIAGLSLNVFGLKLANWLSTLDVVDTLDDATTPQ
jgi:O-acetylserine/cysteine efflux transporter